MDASRHALNGAFVLDFLRAMPLHDPQGFALEYYRQYPALTILFYPPLFYGFLAVAYAVFGVSESSALMVELCFVYALAWGGFRLARHFLPPLPAFCAGLLLIATPGVFFWGQQVMLDVPAFCFLLWSMIFYLRFNADNRPRDIVLCAILAVLAIYTKYNAAFFAGVLGIAMLQRGQLWPGRKTLGPILIALAVAGLMMLPLAAIFLKFSAYNLGQAVSAEDAVAGRWSVAGLSYYARILPKLITWPVLALALAAPVLCRGRLPRDGGILVVWLLLGYAFYSMIAVKEPRHFLFVIFPLIVAALLAIAVLPVPKFLRVGGCVALVAGVFGFSFTTAQPFHVTGMRQAAMSVAAAAPQECNIGFWGRLDGTFIFAMRAYTHRPDLGVVRMDKLLFSDVAVSFERGFTDNRLTPERIIDQVRALHMQFIVAQSDYEADTPSVAAMQAALHSDKFQEIGRFPMVSNGKLTHLNDLVLYRFLEPLPPGRVAPAMQLKLIGKQI